MDLIFLFFIFTLAAFLGFELISKVPSQLHTPLMSGSNAISGITIVGAIIAAGTDDQSWLTTVLGTAAVVLAMINVVGGYLVTNRMLGMFRKRDQGTKGQRDQETKGPRDEGTKGPKDQGQLDQGLQGAKTR